MFKIEGLDEFNRKLKDLERQMQGLDGQRSVPLRDLFPPEFMKRYTYFGSIDEMFEASGFKVDSEEELSNIPDDEWHNLVAQRTALQVGKRCRELQGKHGRPRNSASENAARSIRFGYKLFSQRAGGHHSA